MNTYEDLLRASIRDTGSVLCVGLDPDLHKLRDTWQRPGESDASVVERFCKTAIAATSDIASSFKPNLAFFEVLGRDGLRVFGEVCDAIPNGRLIIADAKRGDIGNTADRYATAFLEVFDCDAITLSPLMGLETLNAFTTRADKAVYVLTLTSNSGADDFLTRPIADCPTQAEYIAQRLGGYDQIRPAHVGMVIGATRPEAMAPLLKAHPAGGLLLPGVGAQGGDVGALITALDGHQGIPVIPISRGILFGMESGEEGIRHRATAYHDMLHTLSQAYV
jgi:orotidine-5'-phosphate decarboxylase